MYGLHFDHHTLSIARDGELVANEPLAVETAARDPRFGRAALAAARGRPDEVSLGHWRELGRSESASRNVAIELLAHLRALGVSERVEAVVAVPADLDASRADGAARRPERRRHATRATSSIPRRSPLPRWSIAVITWCSMPAGARRSRRASSGGAECSFEEAFVSERANLLDVYDLWLIAVAATMVKNTRFDPLLSLDVEQRLFADLPALAARAATEGRSKPSSKPMDHDSRCPSKPTCSPMRRRPFIASSRA